MKFRVCLLYSVPSVILFSTAALMAYSSGPLPRLTAGFHEGTCLQCHSSFRLNQGRTVGGIFEIRGVPAIYEAGRTYPITVVIAQPGQSRWGFELSARYTESERQAGQLAPADRMTQTKEAGGIQYIEHTSAGTRMGTIDGPVEFHFNWTAPDSAGGPVVFNAAGNAANGSDTPAGDYIYTAGAFSGVVSATKLAGPRQGILTVAPQMRMSETSRLVDLPNPTDLDKGSMEVLIQHRFFQSISDSTPGDAFGVDFGANINLGFNYAFTNRFSAGVTRARLDQVIGFTGTYEIETNSDSFWKMSLLAGVEGKGNFERQYSPYLQLASAFDYRMVRLHVVPTAVFHSRDETLVRAAPSLAINPSSNNTFSLGVGTDIALHPRVSVIGEAVPRLAGFGGFVKRRVEYSGGVELRTSAHVFTVLVSTSRDFGPSKYAVNAEYDTVSLGFNIYRRIR